MTRAYPLLLLVLISCAKKAAPAETTPAPTPEPPVDEVSQASRTGWTSSDKAFARQQESIRKAPAAGILRVTRVDDECSNAGGTHLTLEVITLSKGGPHKSIAAGGHALWISAKPGDIFVAGIGPPAASARRSQHGWCIDDLPPVDGYATTILPADTIDAAHSLLQKILGTGSP